MSNEGGQTVPRITKAEHIGPDDTGDNIEAKRTANYEFDGEEWHRAFSGLFTKPFDRLIVTYTDDTKTVISTAVSKLNGVTQETITNSYTDTVDDFARS